MIGTTRANARWRAAAPEEFVWADWGDDEFVLYHRRSGRTHFVNSGTAALLQQVLLEPSDAAAASRALAVAQGAEPSAVGALTAHMSGLLARLEELGLVQCVSD